jgi:hypothetical protein
VIYFSDFATASSGGGPVGGVIDFQGLSIPGRITLAVNELQFSGDDLTLNLAFYIGGSLQSSGYRRFNAKGESDGTSNDAFSASETALLLAASADSAAGMSFAIDISNSPNALYKEMSWHGVFLDSSGNATFFDGAGILENTGTLDGIRVWTSTGTIDSGKAQIIYHPIS